MRHAVFIAPFGPLADPHRLLDVAVAVEENGWDGLFLWDHVLRPESNEILDPWVSLGAIATATHRLRLGTMVTPAARRRVVKLAREVLTVDHLSDGRVTVGLGLGVDTAGELTRLGEIIDPVTRGRALDESASVLARLLGGEVVDHDGEHVTVEGVMLEPRPVQMPRPPMWFAARGAAPRPVRRAARYDGIFPIELDAELLDRMVAEITDVRGSLDGFDVALKVEPGSAVPTFAADVATWAMHAWPAVADIGHLFATIVHGPPD